MARHAASSRLSPPSTPRRSVVIHAAVLALWMLLFAQAFSGSGLLGWSVGAAYIIYDTLLLAFVGWQTWRLLKPEQPAARDAEVRARPTLAVIVAAHDEAAVLPVTLDALLAQTDPPDAIVIADDGSNDGTGEMLIARYGLIAESPDVPGVGSASHPSLRWLRLPHGGKARALNAAIGHLRHDVVLTVDADTLLDPEAIAEALGSLENVDTITGSITYQGTDGVPKKTVTIGAIEGGKFVYKDAFVPEFIAVP